MKIIKFDIQKGIYYFELDDIHTSFHAHPAIEIIYASQGMFTINTLENTYNDLSFAIIDAQVEHALITSDAQLQLFMIESHNSIFYDCIAQMGITLSTGICTEKKMHPSSLFFDPIIDIAHQNDLKTPTDNRIQKCIDILEGELLAYKNLIPTLTEKVHLSESRLSHLFTSQIGISLKKYLVWCRLKKSTVAMIQEDINLLEASYRGGFYDQAHLSNAFKNMLGIPPSNKYNSRMIQL